MRVLHIASEVAPFSQSGGLAQVAGALPAALARTQPDVEVAVLSPLYRVVRQRYDDLEDTGIRYQTHLAGRDYQARVLAASDRLSFFVDCPELYDRDGLYTDAYNNSWGDNPVRFALLSRIAVDRGAAILGGKVDVYHAHDWQSGLVAAYLELLGETEATTVFTIHNLAFQGVFDKGYVDGLGLDWRLFTVDGFEFYDQLNFLKSGAAFSSFITTVSPTYADEILEDANGQALAGFFRQRRSRLRGILNGIDTAAWDPATDPALPAHFTAGDMDGKRLCREALCERFGLEVAADQLLCGVVSRLAMQKGPDLIAELVPELAGIGCAMILVGSGDPDLEHRFSTLAEWFSDHLSVYIGYDDDIARQVFAGCDAILMPSRFEPCGLAQLSAMRYGTLPIVHAVGGLVDTVLDPGDARFGVQPTTGFCFQDLDAGGLEWATERAATLFRSNRALWNKVVADVMNRDWSWDSAADKYMTLYRGEPDASEPAPRSQSRRDESKSY